MRETDQTTVSGLVEQIMTKTEREAINESVKKIKTHLKSIEFGRGNIWNAVWRIKQEINKIEAVSEEKE